jgi:peroxiredoxin family protein
MIFDRSPLGKHFGCSKAEKKDLQYIQDLKKKYSQRHNMALIPCAMITIIGEFKHHDFWMTPS